MIALAPPTAFRLFVKGWNETDEGRVLFDELAAASVVARTTRDVMIDLEHQSLTVKPTEAGEPTACDARGWCRLELRRDGSLWAAGVRWTRDGRARLRQGRQRYVDPVFEVDTRTHRLVRVLSLALTSFPATYNARALVAASVHRPKEIAIMTTKKSSAFDASQSQPPSPHDAQKLIAQIAELLGVEDPDHADHDTIDQALDALFAVVTGGDGSGGPEASQLTAQQLRICRETGTSPASFLAAKRAVGGVVR